MLLPHPRICCCCPLSLLLCMKKRERKQHNTNTKRENGLSTIDGQCSKIVGSRYIYGLEPLLRLARIILISKWLLQMENRTAQEITTYTSCFAKQTAEHKSNLQITKIITLIKFSDLSSAFLLTPYNYIFIESLP